MVHRLKPWVAGNEEPGGVAGTSGATRSPTAVRLASVLNDAWLTALQVHPSEHPCACVLYIDNGDEVIQALSPSPRHNLHQTLMDPENHIPHEGVPQLSSCTS